MCLRLHNLTMNIKLQIVFICLLFLVQYFIIFFVKIDKWIEYLLFCAAFRVMWVQYIKYNKNHNKSKTLRRKQSSKIYFLPNVRNSILKCSLVFTYCSEDVIVFIFSLCRQEIVIGANFFVFSVKLRLQFLLEMSMLKSRH